MDILDGPTPIAMGHGIADLISKVQDDDFYSALFAFLGNQLPYSSGHVLKYRDNETPVILHDGKPQRYEHLDEYVAGYYLLDPLWTKLKDGTFRDNIYVLSRLAPDSFSESSYYEQHYGKAQIRDEIGWIVKANTRSVIVLCLMRRWDCEPYQSDRLNLARLLHPIVSSLVNLHERLISVQHQTVSVGNVQKSPSASINTYLTLHGEEKKLLSDRQTDIVDLILQGHSTESIALNLSISVGTVKTHKRNIYSRLGISSHGELFGMFVSSLKGE